MAFRRLRKPRNADPARRTDEWRRPALRVERHELQDGGWGQYNVFEHNVGRGCEWQIKTEQEKRSFNVTYEVAKPTWYVLSGVANGVILYQKGILQDDMFKTLDLEYPLSKKDSLNSVVNRIVASFAGTK